MARALRIVMLGPPGAGKGTQSILSAKARGIPHISTGEIMRAAVKAETVLGKKVKKYLDAGELVPDTLVIQLIQDRIGHKDCVPGFVLDGFPRTVGQASALDDLLGRLGQEITHVVDLRVAEGVLLERIKMRGVAGSGRSDDSGEVAARRLKVYWEQTAPVTAYYQSRGKVVEVDGLGTVEEVQKRIEAVLAK